MEIFGTCPKLRKCFGIQHSSKIKHENAKINNYQQNLSHILSQLAYLQKEGGVRLKLPFHNNHKHYPSFELRDKVFFMIIGEDQPQNEENIPTKNAPSRLKKTKKSS